MLNCGRCIKDGWVKKDKKGENEKGENRSRSNLEQMLDALDISAARSYDLVILYFDLSFHFGNVQCSQCDTERVVTNGGPGSPQ